MIVDGRVGQGKALRRPRKTAALKMPGRVSERGWRRPRSRSGPRGWQEGWQEGRHCGHSGVKRLRRGCAER